jgi:hypothetical protein
VSIGAQLSRRAGRLREQDATHHDPTHISDKRIAEAAGFYDPAAPVASEATE